VADRDAMIGVAEWLEGRVYHAGTFAAMAR
jgi:hypothetical protein